MRSRFLVFLLLACGNVSAQKQILAGHIQFPGQPAQSYYLEISVEDSVVMGYSITDYTGGNRLKASVFGRITRANELYIQEAGPLDGPTSGLQTYCYFSAYLNMTTVGGKRRWSGPFESKQIDGTPCENGIMSVTAR